MVRWLHFQDRRLLNRRNILSGELLTSENSGIVFLYQPFPHPEKCLALCRLLQVIDVACLFGDHIVPDFSILLKLVDSCLLLDDHGVLTLQVHR